MKRLVSYGFILAFAAATFVAVPGQAADDPVNAIKYRQTVMKANGALITGISAIVKGEASQSADHVYQFAAGLNGMAKLIPDAFKQKTGSEAKNGAKPEIWTDWEKFVAAAKALETESAKMMEIAQGGDMAAIGKQLGGVGGACGGCHKPFREK